MKGVKMFEKKPTSFKSPDMSKLQEVVIALDADPEEARNRYWTRINAKNKLLFRQ